MSADTDNMAPVSLCIVSHCGREKKELVIEKRGSRVTITKR